MHKITITYQGRMVQLSTTEFWELFHNTKKMITWGTGGSYGDGGEIIDKVGLKRAERVVEKLKGIFG